MISSTLDKWKYTNSVMTTWRSRGSKPEEQITNQSTTDQPFLKKVPRQIDDNQKLLRQALQNQKYCHRPVSVISFWSKNYSHLKSITKGIIQLYKSKVDASYSPQFHIVKGSLTDTFIFEHVMEQNISKQNQMLIEYTISSTIVLVIKQNDEDMQNKILKLAELIRDKLHYDKFVAHIRPHLVICKLIGQDSRNEQKWRAFISKLTTWRCFTEGIQIIDIQSQFQQKQNKILKNRNENKKSGDEIHIESDNIKQSNASSTSQQLNAPALPCCVHLKQIIRKNSRPHGVLNQIITGRFLSNIVKSLQYTFSNSSYINILKIYKEIITEHQQRLHKQYKEVFYSTIDQRMQKIGALRRSELYTQISKAHRQAQRYFSEQNLAIQSVNVRQIQKTYIDAKKFYLQLQRTEENRTVIQDLCEQHLYSRPVSFTKCKRMLAQLARRYVSNGGCEDLSEFLLNIIVTYGDELAWGDELNGLKVKDQKVSALIQSTVLLIKELEQKQERLHNDEYVRELEYNKKAEIAKNIRNRFSRRPPIKQSNKLQALMTQKITEQQIKKQKLQKILKSLMETEELNEQVQKREAQLQSKYNSIQVIKEKLQLQRKEKVQEQRRQLERKAKQQAQNSIIKIKEPSILASVAEHNGSKKKRRCSCFGF